jgi:hypothetical protein
MTVRPVVTAFISLAVAAPVTQMITLAGDDDMCRRCVRMATAAAALGPIGNEWWSGGGQVRWTDQRIVATAVAAAPDHPGLDRFVLIAIAVAAVGAFTVLQLRAWSRRRSPSRRSRDIYDWRTLPPPSREDDPGPGETPTGQQESFGPLWRYGAPRGYRGDYEPGREPARGPGYARDSDAGPVPGDNPGSASSGPGPGPGSGSAGPGPGLGPGPGPGFDPGPRQPWRVRGDTPRDWRP